MKTSSRSLGPNQAFNSEMNTVMNARADVAYPNVSNKFCAVHLLRKIRSSGWNLASGCRPKH